MTPKPVSLDPYAPDHIPVTQLGLPSADFDPRRDPFRPDVEAVQEYANQLFGTAHGSYAASGKANDRYKRIHRQLHWHKRSVDDLRLALDECKADQWWREKGIVDTETIFRTDKNVQQWLDRGQGNTRRPAPNARDTRHLECAPLLPGQVADSYEL